MPGYIRNPFSVISLIICIGTIILFFINCQSKNEDAISLPPYSIGHIPFSEDIDDPEFKLCNNGYFLENGGRRSSYKGGVKKMWEFLQPTFDQLKYKKGEDGYLTIRFLANCKGEKDRFRLLAINKRYKPKEFPREISNLLLEAIKKAPGWEIANYKGKDYDGYNMVTFKINNGQVVDLIP